MEDINIRTLNTEVKIHSTHKTFCFHPVQEMCIVKVSHREYFSTAFPPSMVDCTDVKITNSRSERPQEHRQHLLHEQRAPVPVEHSAAVGIPRG